MTVHPSRAELRHYLARDGSLGPGQLERIEDHLEDCPACWEVLDAMTDDEVPTGTTLPHLGPRGYRAYRLLGAGTFGEVWLAQDLNLPRVVAVKAIRPGVDDGRRASAIEALRTEAELLTGIDHPNVVRVHAWLTVGGRHYLVMQYVAGGSLDQLLKDEGPLEWSRAARYVADVGEALVEVHVRGIVHRDVKPSNILWDPASDEALLTDFGVGSRLSGLPSVGGSLPYMAPEAFDGEVSPALDVFGLAATLFHLANGSVPFPGTKIHELREQALRGLPDPDPRCLGLPEPLECLIRAGLAADPVRRPGLRDFVAALRGTLNQLLADTLAQPPAPLPGAAPVDLRLRLSRHAGAGRFEPVAASCPLPGRVTRDMKRVPPAPEHVRLRTGDRLRVDAVADRDGYLTVFNVGPAGHLNLLHPEGLSPPAAPIPAHRPLEILDVELTPPAGRERLFAVWSRRPLRLEHLSALASPRARSSPYRATRDMKRVQVAVDELRPQDRHAVVVEVEHVS